MRECILPSWQFPAEISGERRYACFAESGLEGAQDGQQADWVKRTNILDESDPLNDIEDYPTELNEQVIYTMKGDNWVNLHELRPYNNRIN